MTREQLSELKDLVNRLQPDEYQPSSWQIGDMDTARAVGKFVTLYGQMPINPARKPFRNPFVVMRLLWRNMTKNIPPMYSVRMQLKTEIIRNRDLANLAAQLKKEVEQLKETTPVG